MGARLNWDKVRFVGKRTLSIKDESEYRGNDRAARFLDRTKQRLGRKAKPNKGATQQASLVLRIKPAWQRRPRDIDTSELHSYRQYLSGILSQKCWRGHPQRNWVAGMNGAVCQEIARRKRQAKAFRKREHHARQNDQAMREASPEMVSALDHFRSI
jgi:hypothetical protein